MHEHFFGGPFEVETDHAKFQILAKLFLNSMWGLLGTKIFLEIEKSYKQNYDDLPPLTEFRMAPTVNFGRQ